MIRPPASALLDDRWNRCLDTAGRTSVSPAEVAWAWDEIGPDLLLAALRALAAGGEIAAREAG